MMFGTNEIVGKKMFASTEDKLLVTSRFTTLQGEGPLSGKPAFFVRLAKCNLACSFCDTYFDSGDWFTFDELDIEIEKTISEFFKGDVPVWAAGPQRARQMALVITGGEPSLQPALVKWLWTVFRDFKYTQIESNGILPFDNFPNDTILVISPKCHGANEVTGYIRPHPKNLSRARALKFVMSADESSNYSCLPDWAFEWRDEWPTREIYISPMNVYNRLPNQAQRKIAGANADIATRSLTDEVVSFWDPGLLNQEQNKKNHEYAANYAIRHGCTFGVQTHLLASVA